MLEKIREWYKARADVVRTHSGECWKWHTECMARLLLKEIDKLEDQRAMTAQTAKNRLIEIRKLRRELE